MTHKISRSALLWDCCWTNFSTLFSSFTDGSVGDIVAVGNGVESAIGVEDRLGALLLMQDEGGRDKNYYINEFGRMQVNAPWYGPEYHRLCTEIDWNDLEIR